MKKNNDLNLSTLVELHLDRLKTLNYSKYTIINRRSTLRTFMRFCLGKNIQYPYQLTEDIIKEHLEYLSKLPGKYSETAKPQTVLLRFSDIRMFCDYLCKKQLLLADPSKNIERITKQEHTPVQTLTKMQIEKIMSMPDMKTPKGIRDRAILETFYSTGLRRNELSNLLLADAHLNSKTIFVIKGKGNRDRMVPIGERACIWVEKYLSDGRSFFTHKHDDGHLFLNYVGKQISVDQLSIITRKYIKKADINKKGACHVFRHTAATHMLEGGAEIGQIQEFLGHANSDTTEIYAHVSRSRLKTEYRRTHPAMYMESQETDKTNTTGKKIVMKITKKAAKKSIDDVLGEYPNDEFGKLLRKFCELLKGKDYAEQTIRNHLKNSGDLLDWCKKQGIIRVSQITSNIIEDYQKHLTKSTDQFNKPASPQKQYKVALSLRAFFRTIYQASLALHNPMDGVALPRKTKRLPFDVLSTDEIEKILASPNTSRPYGLRDRAVMELLYASAMRRLELVSILIKDIDFDNKNIRIRGENERTLPLADRAIFWIKKYIENSRPEFTNSPDNEYLFSGTNSNMISSDTITEICGNHIQKSKVCKRGSAHIFRKTAAVLMLENGIDLRTLQEYMGHKRANSTQQYAKLNISKLREVHERTHPGANIRTLN